MRVPTRLRRRSRLCASVVSRHWCSCITSVVLMGLAWWLASGDTPPASQSRFVWARFVRDAAGNSCLPCSSVGWSSGCAPSVGVGRSPLGQSPRASMASSSWPRSCLCACCTAGSARTGTAAPPRSSVISGCGHDRRAGGDPPARAPLAECLAASPRASHQCPLAGRAVSGWRPRRSRPPSVL